MAADVIPDSHLDLLERDGFAHLASLGPDGEPQSHPVWYDWHDGHLRISTTRQRQKFRNIQRDRRVSATILDPNEPYRYLDIRGTVVEVEDDPDKWFIDELARKYLGKDEYPKKEGDGDRVIIHIQPVRAATMG